MLLSIVGVVASRKLAHIDTKDVLAALSSIPTRATLLSVAYAFVSYVTLSLYDGMGIRYLGERLSRPKILFTSFISYAFNFNLGSLLGAVAMRYKLYRQWGLSYRNITKLTAFCIVTSWIGYFFVTGLALTALQGDLAEVPLPAWLNPQLAGGIVLFILAGVLAFFLTRDEVCVWGRVIRSPSRPMIFAQLGVASFQWLMQPLLIFTLLNTFEPIRLPMVLITFLLASVLALAAHVPAGLGVLEGTFLMAFEDRIPTSDILAAMLAFRMIYFFAPLCLAVLLFFGFTLTHKRKLPNGTNEDEWNKTEPKRQPAIS